jgi:hypothetical protein
VYDVTVMLGFKWFFSKVIHLNKITHVSIVDMGDTVEYLRSACGCFS